jgi:hypothetical protein
MEAPSTASRLFKLQRHAETALDAILHEHGLRRQI